MSGETWLLFFVAYLVVTLSSGPNVLLVVKNALQAGYKAAALTIMVNLFCQLLIIIAVALGAGALLAKSPLLFLALKLIGGSYLIYLGLKGWLEKNNKAQVALSATDNERVVDPVHLAKQAFFVSASNPKTVIFLSAFLPQFITADTSITWQFMVMFFTICLIVTTVHLGYAYLARNIGQRCLSVKMKSMISKLSSSAFIVFGCSVLCSHRTA